WLTANEPFRPIEIDSLRSIYEYPETEILVAKVYGNDGGFIILDFEGQNDEIGVIAGLGVLPRYQRKGLGTVLGMAAWNYFKEQNVEELRCEVYKDNHVSYNFIKSLGFEEYDKKTYTKDDFVLDTRN
ncbi:MAG: GNAT family N-acetyltransferase, partial [Candidatus Lokiarchaeota archaeon]|nr:GNAT family N-acetyltransferase [Candidatus Lokiarchaeota archaeon]MBD3200854.1 GNAT family N-acetyltransferase [Candidatus Lokiarchaeota archaeon]